MLLRFESLVEEVRACICAPCVLIMPCTSPAPRCYCRPELVRTVRAILAALRCCKASGPSNVVAALQGKLDNLLK